MSWDADLIGTDLDGHTFCVREWNYTHNCNGMANTVIGLLMPDGTLEQAARRWWQQHNRPDVVARIDDGEVRGTWWELLDTATAKESLPILDLIIGGLMEAPSMFREMNPPNGWGDYDSFLAVLVEMRATAAEYPSARWRVSG